MSGRSATTQIVPIRLRNEVVEILKRRVAVPGKYQTVSSYLRDMIEYQVMRSHHKDPRWR
jgi:Arc/MetJ-type ribon-helix-helix transcriptional regulator